jgi:uncharacterized damage-inducible protein DinB
MRKIFSAFLLSELLVLLVTFVSAQEKKSVEPPQPVQGPSQELLGAWNYLGGKVIAMAEDFPEDKYNFKAQKDERTFGENLIHIASVEYMFMNLIKGGSGGSEDSALKKNPTKADIVKFVKQATADGAELIKTEGENGLSGEFKFPFGNMMVHNSYGWWFILEHTGEHFGQLVVYYRVNGMIPPESRPKK